MSYVPSDFDNLSGGFNLLDVRENQYDLNYYAGPYSNKGLGYKQKNTIYNTYNGWVHDTRIDFCIVFKYPTWMFQFYTLKIYEGSAFDTIIQSIDLNNYTHTVTQDSDGNEVWLYEDFDFSDLEPFWSSIWNNRAFAITIIGEEYVGSESNIKFDLSSYLQNGINGTTPANQQIVIKYVNEPTINFTIARKDNISEIMEVTFDGTFDNQNVGTTTNALQQISLNYIDPNTYTSKQVTLTRDVDYVVSGNSFHSGTGSSASSIDIDIEEMFYQGVMFVLYVSTTVNQGSDQDETYSNLPAFDWGKENNVKYLNVNGDFKIDDVKVLRYSTDETFTGKYWIDGKKIYKKTFTGTIPTLSGGWDNLFSISSLSINELIDIQGMCGNGKLPRYSDINYYIDIQYAGNYVMVVGKGYSNQGYIVTLYYTKSSS